MNKILIVFTDVHVAYSPTTLNLFYVLKKNFHVELLSPKPVKSFSELTIDDPDVIYLELDKPPTIFERVFMLLIKVIHKLFKLFDQRINKWTLLTTRARAIISYIKKKKNFEIIAVDGLALWCAQQAKRKAHFLSLELIDDYFKHVDYATIQSLIIQSKERMDFLFPEKMPRHFFVQNAPKFIDFEPLRIHRKKNGLIFCGSATTNFGFISCLDFIKDYKDYTLTLIGALPENTKTVIFQFYKDLLEEKRLIIVSNYLDESELCSFVSSFRIGFAFYDFYRFDEVRTFNYFSAPSGKVFQYLNSGIPIIANRIPGFEFLHRNRCGVLINHISSIQIKNAIDIIETDYENYVNNAKLSSREYDFTTQIKPFLNFLQTKE